MEKLKQIMLELELNPCPPKHYKATALPTMLWLLRPSPGHGETNTINHDFATYFPFQYAHSLSMHVVYAHTSLFADCHCRTFFELSDPKDKVV